MKAIAEIPDLTPEQQELRQTLRNTPEGQFLWSMGLDYYDTESVARRVAEHAVKQLAEAREALNSFDAIDKERNDALKVCMNLLETMHFNRCIFKVDAYTKEIEAAMAQIKTCYDPHA